MLNALEKRLLFALKAAKREVCKAHGFPKLVGEQIDMAILAAEILATEKGQKP